MRSRLVLLLRATAIGCAVVACPSSSAAAPCDPAPLWQLPTTITESVSDMRFGYGLSFFARGATVYAVWNETGATPVPHVGGTVKWTWTPGTGASIENFPSPVPLPTGEYVFVGASDGFLYKIDALTGATAGSADTRRPSCPEDRVVASPTVQLYALSNPAFQSDVIAARGHPDDVVFVATRTGCSDESSNRVIAYYASDLAVRWTFNADAAHQVDYFSAAPAIDHARNRLYAGTHQAHEGDNSLFALPTVGTTSVDPVWAGNAGSIGGAPVFDPGTDRIYVGNAAGEIMAWAPSEGAKLWGYPAGDILVRDPWVQSRAPLATRLYFVGETGLLKGIQDDGMSASSVWPPIPAGDGLGFVTRPGVVSLGGVEWGYVGRSDGTIQEVDLTAGSRTLVAPAGGSGAVYDPSFDVSTPTAPSVNRLMVPYAAGTMARYCIPWTGPVSVPEGDAAVGGRFAWIAPNPFSNGTRVEYDLPFDGFVEMDVFDLGGQRVRALLRERQTAGRHQAAWKGLDDAGQLRASGLYFCRVRLVGPGGRTIERTTKVQLVR